MNPNHHPNSALLMAYASGSLTEAFSLVVASHLSFCQECHQKVNDAEMIGGALIDDLEPSNVKMNSLDQILSKLDDISQDPPTVNSPSGDDEIPQPLWNYINSPLDDLNWKFLAPGLRHVSIDADAGKSGTVRLFKITPGTTLPTHSHSGSELALILRGSYSDEIGRFKRGDVADVDHDDTHQPIADTGQECICLIATEGPTVYQGFLNRVLQPIHGI